MENTDSSNSKKRKFEETEEVNQFIKDEVAKFENEMDEKEQTDWSHITEADLELKEFKCPRCNEIFPTTSDLFVHMRQTYKDPTLCKVCGKNLNCMANILSHSYLHQGIKPYKCPKCTYCTRTRFNLRVHFGSCAKIEKFSYKRGAHQKKNRYKPSQKRRKRNGSKQKSIKESDFMCTRANIVKQSICDHDIMSHLVDSGPDLNANRDISCLIRCHVGHFPRSLNPQVGSDMFYQQKRSDINRFYGSDKQTEIPPIV